MEFEPTNLVRAVAGARITLHQALIPLKPPVAEPQLRQLQDAILPRAALAGQAVQSPNTIPEVALAESVLHDDGVPGSGSQTASLVAEAKTTNPETNLEYEVESLLAKQYLSLNFSSLQSGLSEN